MSETSARTHHSLDFIELGVTDFATAKSFYGNAFGWTFTDYGPGPSYVGIRSRGAENVEVGGFRLDSEVISGGPLVLLFSADLNSSVQAVRDAGGEVTHPPYEFPGGRRFLFKDPSGNELGVWSTE